MNRILIDQAFVQEYFPNAKDYEDFVTDGIDASLEEKLLPYYLD